MTLRRSRIRRRSRPVPKLPPQRLNRAAATATIEHSYRSPLSCLHVGQAAVRLPSSSDRQEGTDGRLLTQLLGRQLAHRGPLLQQQRAPHRPREQPDILLDEQQADAVNLADRQQRLL